MYKHTFKLQMYNSEEYVAFVYYTLRWCNLFMFYRHFLFKEYNETLNKQA